MVAWFTVVVEAYCVYDNNFLVVSSFRKKEKRPEETRKVYTISPTYQHKPCSQGNQSFFSNKLQWMGVQSYAATNYCACMFPGAQGRGLGQPPWEPPALQLVGELSCPPLTSSAGQ